MSDNPRASLGPGARLDGFVIEAVAGRGGMGVVYRARQERPDRVVALKVIAADLADDEAFRARFQRESSIAAQIEHPNVIPVYALGEADGVLYIAMRFVDGTDLRGLMAEEGRLEPRRAAAIAEAVAQALDAAHAHGLVHRDVKPANILISRVGGREHVYLSDFGLSRHVEGSQGLTGTGAFLGTIDYVAPEQARGDRIDARADVYSLGCVLFEALTGTVPFPLDNDLAKLYAHDRKPPPSVLERTSDLPAAFEPVLARAMAKSPDERYLSAGDLGRAAAAAASGASLSRAERNVAVGTAAPADVRAVQAPAPSPGSSRSTVASGSAPSRRPPMPLLVGVAGIVVAGVLVALLTSRGDQAPERRSAGGTGVSAAVNARPTGIPEGCTSNGVTQFAKDLRALRAWGCTTPSGTEDVTGASLTYLEFASPAKARESLRGSVRFELVDDVQNRWERCRGARPEDSLAGEAFCLRSRKTGTIEFVWHPADTSVMGNATFDRPTPVPNALAAWKRAL